MVKKKLVCNLNLARAVRFDFDGSVPRPAPVCVRLLGVLIGFAREGGAGKAPGEMSVGVARCQSIVSLPVA